MKARWPASQSAVRSTCSVRFVMKLLPPVGRMKAKRKLWLRASRAAAAIGAVAELGHRRLDPRDGLLAHALAPVDHAVDGRQRNAGRARDVFQCRASGGAGFATRRQRAAQSRPRVMIVRISGTSSS